MFTFPTYSGSSLPDTVNPLNLKHYGMLLKWIYFQPARLIHYLYQSDPDLYRSTGLTALLRTFSVPAYRTLYVMPIVMVAGLLGLFWIVFELFGMASVEILASILGGVLLGGIIGGTAFSICFALTFGVAEGVAEGVAFGIAFSLTYGIAEGIAGVFLGGVGTGMTFGVALGVALGVSGGVSGRVGGGVVEGIALAVGGGLMLGVAGGMAFGIALGVGLLVGASRILLHVYQWPLSFWVSRNDQNPFESLERHPALWDSQAVLPLPGADRLLRTALDLDFGRAMDLAMRVAVNPFQRWAVQKALSQYAADHDDPLRLLYHIMYAADFDHYLMPPRTQNQFHVFPTRRIVLLGELGQVRVDGSGGAYESSQHMVWSLTRRRRHTESTPVTRLSAMLYELLREEANRNIPEDIREQRTAIRFAPMDASAYESVRSLPGGIEVADSFANMSAFLDVDDLDSLADCHVCTDWIQSLNEEPIRPSLIEALRVLGEVSRDVQIEQNTTNVSQQYEILNKVGEALLLVTDMVAADVLLPERSLLNRITRQWQSIIATEQVRLGETTLKKISDSGRQGAQLLDRATDTACPTISPFKNPYVAGNPVAPPLFVRHSTVFDRAREILEAPTTAHVITVTGTPGLGVTSVLHNLDQVAAPGNILVYEDMAGAVTFVDSAADLLLGLADKMHATVRRTYPRSPLQEPDPGNFTTVAHARFHFNRLMMQVCDLLAGRPLILAFDNFEAVEDAVNKGTVEQEIYQYLLSVAQEPQIVLVLGGSPELAELHDDHRRILHDHTEHIQLTPLPSADAWTLVTNPAPDFTLGYEPEAVERIISETGGHPYQIQYLCHELVDRLNNAVDSGQEDQEALIRVADVVYAIDHGALANCRGAGSDEASEDAAG